MKIYKHEGNGHYIGSLALVIEHDRGCAEAIIRRELDEAGLKNEPLNITEYELDGPLLVYFQDGNY